MSRYYIGGRSGRPRVERGADGPPEEQERTSCFFGELLIGAKFWFKDEQYMKMGFGMARREDAESIHYIKFNDDDIVEDIT